MLAAIIASVIFIAALQQSLSGFGFALISMPILVHVAGIQVAAPLVAVLALLLNLINGYRWRDSFDLSELKRVGVWMLLGVPVGIWGIFTLNVHIVNWGLGILLISYALFALLRPKTLPKVSQRWAYPAGFAAGVLGGAYNTAGPPLILYGSLRAWSNQKFRAVLQSLFAVSASVVVLGHLVAGHYTRAELRLIGFAVPGLLLGILLGARLERHLKPAWLKKWITIITLLLGLSLLLR